MSSKLVNVLPIFGNVFSKSGNVSAIFDNVFSKSVNVLAIFDNVLANFDNVSSKLVKTACLVLASSSLYGVSLPQPVLC